MKVQEELTSVMCRSTREGRNRRVWPLLSVHSTTVSSLRMLGNVASARLFSSQASRHFWSSGRLLNFQVRKKSFLNRSHSRPNLLLPMFATGFPSILIYSHVVPNVRALAFNLSLSHVNSRSTRRSQSALNFKIALSRSLWLFSTVLLNTERTKELELITLLELEAVVGSCDSSFSLEPVV